MATYDVIDDDAWNAMPTRPTGPPRQQTLVHVRQRKQPGTYNVYGLCEPGTTTVRYIGKVMQKRGESTTHSLERRLCHHLHEARTKEERHNHRLHWLRALIAQERRPDMMLIDVGDERTWKDIERFHIKAHRQAGFRLVNSTDGGDGSLGMKHSPAACLKISTKAKGRVAHNKGKPRTDAEKAKMSAAAKARVAGRPHCVNGHELIKDNAFFNTYGTLCCRICSREAVRRYRQTRERPR